MAEAVADSHVWAQGLESPLCGKCRDVLVVLDKENTQIQYLSFGGTEAGRSKQATTTLRSIKDRADRGCHLCSLLFAGKPRSLHDRSVSQDFNDTEIIQYRVFWEYQLHCANRTIHMGVLSKDDFVLHRYALLDLERNSSKIVLPSRVPCHLKANIYRARQWLSKCSTHKRCSQKMPFLPTRLLKVYKSDPPRIHLTLTTNLTYPPPYMTLSHCWGDSQPMGFLQQNLEAMLENIPFDLLPKTFQHASLMTQLLGCSYIWTDSLYIIQDSTPDWQHESGLIGRVYASATCNLSATSSSSSSDGLFFPPVSACSSLSEMVIACIRNKTLGDQYLYFYNQYDWKEVVDEGPLNSRAWVMQERLLSRCNVHFGKRQLYFECHEKIANQTFPMGYVSEHYKVFSDGPEEEDRITTSGREGFDDESHTIWATLVENYSKRLLTVSTDRLVAISGLVTTFRSKLVLQDPKAKTSRLELTYLAGLWFTSLTSQLLWRTVDASQNRFESSGIELPYIAPSWSWASANAGVQDAYDRPNIKDGRDLTRIISASTELLSREEPFGHILSGLLLMRGILALCSPCRTNTNALLLRTRSGEKKLESTELKEHEIGYYTVPFALYWDVPRVLLEEKEGLSESTLYLLPLSTSQYFTIENLICLINVNLRQEEELHESQRRAELSTSSLLQGLVLQSCDVENLGDEAVLPTKFRRVGTWRINDTGVAMTFLHGLRFGVELLGRENIQGQELVDFLVDDERAFDITIV